VTGCQRRDQPDHDVEGLTANSTIAEQVAGFSPQKPDGSQPTTEAKELTFTVLSDPGNQIAAQLGILAVQSEPVTGARLKPGLDLTEVSADGTTTLPRPAVLIVHAAGIIRVIDAHRDYTTRSEPSGILHALTGTIG
jgi:hypothetical protein